ncbi:hypothetical protein ACFL2C_04240 [Patescibacteria group bacterium]
MPAQTRNQNPPKAPPEQINVLFSWTALERPFKRRNREFWVSVSAIAAIASLILYLIEGPITVILIISLVFLFYMLSTVEPQTIKYEITNKSINIAGNRNDLSLFVRYWFGERFGADILILQTMDPSLPGRLELVINAKDKEKIRKALNNYFIEDEELPDNVDQAASWLSGKIPGNS